MHVDRVDLSAIQPMDVGATLPSDGCPQLRERHGPFSFHAALGWQQARYSE